METKVFILVICLGSSGLLSATGTGQVQNPCTADTIEMGQLYHPYPSDPRRFIQCTEWGKAYARLCPVGQIWFQSYLTCVDMEHDAMQPPSNGGNGGGKGSGMNGNGMGNGMGNGGKKSNYGQNTGNGDAHMTTQQNGQVQPWEHYMKSQIGQSKIQNGQMMNQGNQMQTMNGYQPNNNGQQPTPWNPNGDSNGNQGKSMGHNGQGNGNNGKSMGQNGLGNGNNGKSMGQNGHGNGNGKSMGQNGYGNGNNGKSMGQNGYGNGNNGKFMGQNGYENGNTGNGQGNGNNGKSMGQNGYGNGNNGKSMGQNGQGNGNNGKSMGQNGQGNGNYGKSWGQNGQNNGNPNGDNPCYDQNTPYIAHSTNPTKFFECDNGNPIMHQCEYNHVWDQDTMSCQPLEQPGTGDESNDNGEALPNPCVGSTEKFHPYPNDPHKFIECMTWYSMQVWDCGEEAVWMQDKQVCALVYENGGQNGGNGGQNGGNGENNGGNGGQNGGNGGYNGGNGNQNGGQNGEYNGGQYGGNGGNGNQNGGNGGYNGGQNGGNGGPVYPLEPKPTQPPTEEKPTDNVCYNTSQFYHAYPEDPSKFIQCDTSGNMYIRHCGPNKLWSEVFLTCVAASTGGKDGSYPPPQNGNGIMTKGDEDVSVTIDSTVFVSDLNNMCPEHEYFDHDSHSCKPKAMAGPVHSQPMNMVIMDDWSYNTCPPRFEWNSEQSACVEIEPLPEPKMEHMVQDCEPGYMWDAATGMCIQAINTNTYESHMTKPKPVPYNPDYQIIDRGGLTPYGYIDDYENLDDYEPYDDEKEDEESKVELPTYDGPNPCVTSYGFFFEFPGNPGFYIQCDEWRQMHVQACPSGLSWDSAISTCMDTQSGDEDKNKSSQQYNGGDQYTKEETTYETAPPQNGYKPSSQNNDQSSSDKQDNLPVDLHALLNPCRQETYSSSSKSEAPSNYHPHPFDPRRFIICSNGTPYIMICPHSSVWEASLHTCVANSADSYTSNGQGYKSVQY